MIAYSEIGPDILAMPASEHGYKVCVGSTQTNLILFNDYSSHPRLRNDKLNSDAAGRYQVLGRYFDPYRQRLGLPDFGPESQDRIAVQMMHECRAIDLVEKGHLADAVAACRSRWASLPGAGYGQHENSLEKLIIVYTNSGGVVT